MGGGALAADLAAFTGLPVAAKSSECIHELRPLVHKSVAGRDLQLHRWEPVGAGAGASIVFFHGGGWRLGQWAQFEWHAKYFASRGMRTFAVDYRTEGPLAATEDAVDAFNYLVGHAAELRIDPERIVAAGGSAGGHLAAAAALLTLPNTRFGIRPAALALLNPVTDTTALFPTGYGRQRFDSDAQARAYSPMHHVAPGAAPTLVLHGTDDEVVHVENSARFVTRMREAGNTAELVTYDGQPHGFTNILPLVHNPYGIEGARQIDRFLCELGFLDGPQRVRPDPGQLLGNGDFNQAIRGWSVGSGTRLDIASGAAHVCQDHPSGGISIDVTDAVRARGRGAYLMGARVSSSGTTVELALEVTDSAEGRARSYPIGPTPSSTATRGRIRGTREISWEGRLESVRLVASAPDGGTFTLDDVSLEFLPATVMRYSMADAATGTLVDASGFGHDVTATALTGVADGAEGAAASFDGKMAWVRLKQLGRAAIPGIGIRLWLRPSAAPTGERQVILDGGDGGSPWLYLDTCGRLGTDLGDAPLTDTHPLPVGMWTQVHLSLDQHEVRLTVGDRVVSTSGRSTLNPGIVSLGRPVDPGSRSSGFHGDIDEVEVEDHPASAPGVTSGITVRAAVTDPILPGGRTTADIRVLNALDDGIRNIELTLAPPTGWSCDPPTTFPRQLEGGSEARASWSLAVPDGAEPSVWTAIVVLDYATDGQTSRHIHQIAFRSAATFPAAHTNVEPTGSA